MSPMWTRWGVACALLTSSVLGLMKSGPPVENALAAGKPAAGASAKRSISVGAPSADGDQARSVRRQLQSGDRRRSHGARAGHADPLAASDDVFEMWHLSRQVWLVSQGARVVHHTPAWAPAMLRKVRDLQNSTVYEELRARSHLYTDPDAMVGTFMRIDIPVLGILDEFVLYTDVDVVFKSEIDWSVLLAGADLDAVYGANDFARGRQNFSEPGRQGLPLYFAASSEIEQSEDPGMMNAGVMLMNLRSLRQTYESFKDFIFSDPDLQWDEGPGDQGAIKSFYSDPTGQPHGNFLPWFLNWKPYWAPNADAKLIHFHGPKCSSDIEPYTQTKVVHIEVFGSLFERCTQSGDCVNLCHEFDSYLRRLA